MNDAVLPSTAERTSQLDEFVFLRLLDEVYLLMDFVSGRPDSSLAMLAGIPVPELPATVPSKAEEVVAHISKLRYPPDGTRPQIATNTAFLLMVKDRLNQIAKPAIGMTIAFTALMVSSATEPTERSSGKARRAATRRSFAADAYPGLIGPARRLRYLNWGAMVLMALLTMFTVYTSGVVAFGRSLIERVEETNRLFLTAAAAVKSAESAKDDERAKALSAQICGDKCPPELRAVFVRLCDRSALARWRLEHSGLSQELPPARIGVHGNATEPQTCDPLEDAKHKQLLANAAVEQFEQRHLAPYAALGWVLELLSGKREATPPASGQAADAAAERPNSPEWVAAVLASLGSYLLPMCFTLLGTGVSILRDINRKIHTNTLSPSDSTLSLARLALGMVAGAAIGLFFSPSSLPQQGGAGSLVGPITLSTQGLAFLAGYGVDAVFEAFDRILRRVTDAATPPPPAAGGGGQPATR